MNRAVNIEVNAIDTEYGFTHIQIRDHFSGKKCVSVGFSLFSKWEGDTERKFIKMYNVSNGTIEDIATIEV